MEIKEENIAAIYSLDDGSKYLFLIDKTIYKEDNLGNLTKIKLTKKNLKKMKDEIGTGETDVII